MEEYDAKMFCICIFALLFSERLLKKLMVGTNLFQMQACMIEE